MLSWGDKAEGSRRLLEDMSQRQDLDHDARQEAARLVDAGADQERPEVVAADQAPRRVRVRARHPRRGPERAQRADAAGPEGRPHAADAGRARRRRATSGGEGSAVSGREDAAADGGDAGRGAVHAAGLDLRAEARWRAHAGVRARRQGRAAHRGAGTTRRASIRRSSPGSRRQPVREAVFDGEIVARGRGRRAELPGAAGADQPLEPARGRARRRRDAGVPVRVRPAVPRRLRPAGGAARRAQGDPAARARCRGRT